MIFENTLLMLGMGNQKLRDKNSMLNTMGCERNMKNVLAVVEVQTNFIENIMVQSHSTEQSTVTHFYQQCQQISMATALML